MSAIPETSDTAILDLLRERGALSVSQLALTTKVTATAVRQRLNRMMGQGLIARSVDEETSGRGRPNHRYSLTAQGARAKGNNYADLAVALWEEVRSIPDVKVQRGLLTRIATRLAGEYGNKLQGKSTVEKMTALAELLRDRDMPFRVQERENGELPVLTAHACPYPDLAATDRGLCALERLMVQQVVGAAVRLSECKLDGGSCCQFEVSMPTASTATASTATATLSTPTLSTPPVNT